jgi:hypothetical protein
VKDHERSLEDLHLLAVWEFEACDSPVLRRLANALYGAHVLLLAAIVRWHRRLAR